MPPAIGCMAIAQPRPANRPPLIRSSATPPLPFSSAAEARHVQVDVRWLAEFLECIASAAKAGLDELERLRRAEEISHSLGRTVRSWLPDAANAVLRTSIVTARDLAATLGISPQAVLALLR